MTEDRGDTRGMEELSAAVGVEGWSAADGPCRIRVTIDQGGAGDEGTQ